MNSHPQAVPESTLALNSVLCRHPDQIATEVDGEVLMMNIDTGNYYGLNEVASFAWHRLAQPITVDDLCAAIENEFDVERERLESDTLSFLEGMMKDGLVQRAVPDDGLPASGKAG